ncbi:hypothetical protein LPTSP4_16200 [Leptospira ryugenii]|uniref:Lipoprotein n=1 Tax=Leptospira ryugenii TaxID=1917863 RepID=A0A2P2DZU6_9LEPT|nr:hypothetical protein [Leptospira ryugenii]GBF50096.1 hypothetical protein LPTSP4_16200 [Leptospira ryugenii]
MKLTFSLVLVFALSFTTFLHSTERPKVGETVEVDLYDGTGNNSAYKGLFKINKIDADGYYYGVWVQVPSYYKEAGQKVSNYTDCTKIVPCKAIEENEQIEFTQKQEELEAKWKPKEWLERVLKLDIFKVERTLGKGDVVEICYWPNEAVECSEDESGSTFSPATILAANGDTYEVNARIFDGTMVGAKAGFKDKKLTIKKENIRFFDPKKAPSTEITEEMQKYEVVPPGTLVDTKWNGKWYRAVVRTMPGYGIVEVSYVNWGSVTGSLGLKSPIYEFAPYGSKTTSDTGAFSGMPYPRDDRNSSKIDLSKMKKNKNCPASMPFVSNGICVNELGQWKGARPIRP